MVRLITWQYNEVLYHVAKVNVLVHFCSFSREGSHQLCCRLGAEGPSPEREGEGEMSMKTSSCPGAKGLLFWQGVLVGNPREERIWPSLELALVPPHLLSENTFGSLHTGFHVGLSSGEPWARPESGGGEWKRPSPSLPSS